MKFREIEHDASVGGEFPHRGSLSQQACFLALRCLYGDWRAGRITKEQAQQERRTLESTYLRAVEDEKRQAACLAQYQENLRKVGEGLSQLVRSAQEGESTESLLELSLDCLSRMTGEQVTKEAVLKGVRMGCVSLPNI